MTADLANPVPSPYKDRSGWLIAFGVFEVLIAFFCLMFVLFVILVLTLPQFRTAGSSAQHHVPQAAGLISATIVDGGSAAVFLILGVGSIRCRNWARIAMIVVSGFWLVVGALTTLVIALLFPSMMRQQSGVSPQAAHVGYIMMMALMGVLMVAMPGLFLFFYTRASVRATCLARKAGAASAAPGPNSTAIVTPTSVPGPIIVLAVWQGLGVFGVLGFFMVRSTLFFGVVIHGLPAFLVLISLSTLSGYAARSIYQRRLVGWSLAVGIALFGMASTVATFAGRDMLQVYREMGFPEEQIQVFYAFPQMRWIIWFSILPVMTAYLALLVYTRKFFSETTRESGSAL